MRAEAASLDESRRSMQGGADMMNSEMMGGMGMWGFGLVGLLVLVALILGIAALIKYLRS
jgi:hypothetical protein